MLQPQDLSANFAGIVQLADRVFRCELETRKTVHYYYLRLAQEGTGQRDFLLESGNLADDEFALLVLGEVQPAGGAAKLRVIPLPQNRYGFSGLLLAPPSYHACFKGILDGGRKHLMLCVPMHRCEFSGSESADEFVTMRRETVLTLNWLRTACPKILMRFDNPATRGGTGDSPVLAKKDLLLREIGLLSGVTNGFIEIQNWRGQTLEILSPGAGRFTLIRERNDWEREALDEFASREKIVAFLHSVG